MAFQGRNVKLPPSLGVPGIGAIVALMVSWVSCRREGGNLQLKRREAVSDRQTALPVGGRLQKPIGVSM